MAYLFRTVTLLLILALALVITGPMASAAPPNIADLPKCALSCVLNFPSTGCGSDFVCICRSTEFTNNLTPCIQRSCSPDEAATALDVLCRQ
ncbi:MAG: hypothetical protein J3Q66DRAFT_340838 [Benniella sp.]|nr:MAG: hypothetical protein J3Q66DRAFT_340838 [Benniella sp.]